MVKKRLFAICVCNTLYLYGSAPIISIIEPDDDQNGKTPNFWTIQIKLVVGMFHGKTACAQSSASTLRFIYTEKKLMMLNAIKVAFFYKKYTFMCKTSSIYMAAYSINDIP